MSYQIALADLEAPDFIALIDRHAQLMLSLSPPDSCHFLPIDGLKSPDVTVWEMRENNQLLACGGLKELNPEHGEIKSMHTLESARGRGLGRQMLDHILAVARQRGYTRLSLETGSMEGFAPARTLYETYGFTLCDPFGDYELDPNSVFMTREL